jgi:Holliday junction resolvasome RuvABC DNA-binding subunit
VDELMEFLDTIKANSASTESTVLGYKVKVSYVTSSEIETKIREEILFTSTITNRLNQMWAIDCFTIF